MNRDIWGVFHDGVIQCITGVMPGEVSIVIEIDYLRGMFEGEGTSFTVLLKDCSRFKYRPYDAAPTEEFLTIQADAPEILNWNSLRPLVLACTKGLLELDYEAMSVALDSGAPVTYQALSEASESYWNRWK